jgi:uncharacterized hydrophobic protein (TIGR00341 family)
MGEKNRLFNVQEVAHSEVIEKLVKSSSPRKTFLMLIFLSSIIATLGILNENAFVVIGAMLVAPILSPVLAIGMGLIVRDSRMVVLSILALVFAFTIAIVTAVGVTFFSLPLGAVNGFLQQTDIGFMVPVAIAAGAAAAFAISYSSIREAVAGVAISVALLPPLVTVGIGLGGSDWELMIRALQVFGLNCLGIILVALVIFSLLGFGRFRRSAEQAVKKEQKVLKSK